MKTFILNDETQVNSYGFRVRNKGLNLKRFIANPVMLTEHINSVFSVIGKWVNIRIEGTKLLADAEFDMEDPEAADIAGKVERGFIKGCSMGLLFLRENMVKAIDDVFELVVSELMENSIVAIPSNANCVRLFSQNGDLLTDTAVMVSLSALNNGAVPKMTHEYSLLGSKQSQIDSFSAMALEQQLAYKKNNSAAYYAMFSETETLSADIPAKLTGQLTFDEFCVMPIAHQLAYRDNNPRGYATMINQL